MTNRRKIRVPWYLQRWRLRYILPAILFWFLAGSALLVFRSAPFAVLIAALFCIMIAILFTRIVWQERFPRR